MALIVAGDCEHAMPDPAGVAPHAASVTYLVLMKYPVQFSAVGNIAEPHVMPLSKLYSISNPATEGGGVTVNVSQPVWTTGAGGAAGNITTLTSLLSPQEPVPAVPAGLDPHAVVST